MKRAILFFVVIFVYCFFFLKQDNISNNHKMELSPLLPSMIQKVFLGFMSQLGAEIYFVKAAVFLGTVTSDDDPHDYAPVLSQYFDVSSSLHPSFLDTYFFCQSSLSYIDPEYSMVVNSILDRGIKAIPDNWVLPLFAGYNSMHYLKNLNRASFYLHEAGKRPNAPSWIAHLSTVLSVGSGDIERGISWLQAIIEKEPNQTVRELWKKELAEFNKALRVKKAIDKYRRFSGHYPPSLTVLVPEFIDEIPKMGLAYQLYWDPPNLRLIRKANPEQIRHGN